MVGAADVTNGVRERRSSSGERGDGRETKVIVLVIETSKRSSLEDFRRGGGEIWQREKRGTSVYRVADIGERKGLPGEKAKEENQRQGNVELQKKRKLDSIYGSNDTRPHTVGTVSNCPALVSCL